MKLIDPIVINEERIRLIEHKTKMEQGVNAANALLWFKEYGEKKEVLEIAARLIASSTPNVNFAQAYVSEAAKLFTKDILDKAIDAARKDFDFAEANRRKGNSRY
jgi:hypothetical protein